MLNADPRVRMSLVKARRNPFTGSLVVADVVLDGRCELRSMPDRRTKIKSELLNACRRALAAHKVPAQLRFVPALELSVAGKLVRRGASRPVRNVIVTGGSRGLGLAMSVALAGAGYRVIAVARKRARSCRRRPPTQPRKDTAPSNFGPAICPTWRHWRRWCARCAPISGRCTAWSTTRAWAPAAFCPTCAMRKFNG